MKKYSALILCLALLLSLAACGGSGNAETAAAAETEAETEPAAEAVTEPEEEPAPRLLLKEETTWDYDGVNYYNIFEYSYDENGRKTGYTLIYGSDADEEDIEEVHELIWSDDGLQCSDEFADQQDGVSYSRTEYIYDEAGRVTEEHDYDADGSEAFGAARVFDDDGHCVDIVYSGAYPFYAHVTYEYCEEGISGEVYYDESGNVSTSCSWSYETGEDGVVYASCTYDNGSVVIYERTYDEAGNLLKEVDTSVDGYTQEYSYDDEGNCIEDYYVDVYGDWTRTVYTYALMG